MARIIDARVKQKADTLENLQNNNLKLLDGEQVFVRSDVDNNVMGYKIGVQGKKFSELPYPDYTVRGKVSPSSSWVGRQSGVYIPTVNGTYNGVSVNLADGYQVLYWDGTTIEKVVYPADFSGLVFGGIIDDTFDLSSPTDAIWYIASAGTYNTVPPITLVQDSILAWDGFSWSSKPFDLEVRGDFLVADNVQEIRNMSEEEVSLLVNGTYKGIELLGYYVAGDTPNSIKYFKSSTLQNDDGGSVFEVLGVKFEHKFIGEVDLKYFGAKTGEDIKDIFQKVESKYDVKIDDYYTSSDELLITNSNRKINITNKGYVHNIKSTGSNGLRISPDLQGVVVDGDGTIKGSTTNTTVGYSVAIGENSKNIKLEGIRLDGFTGGVILNHNNKDVKILNNSFYNMTFVPSVEAGGYGIVCQSSFDTIISNNYFDETVERHHIYYAVNWGKTPVVKGSNHTLTSNVFRMKTLSSYITGFEYSVKIMGNDNVTCTGNVLDGGVGGFWITSAFRNDNPTMHHPSNINIVGNVIKNISKGNSNYSSAIGSHGVGTELFNINISENTIDTCDCSSLVSLVNIKSSKITNNILYNNPNGHGLLIDVHASDLLIDGNKIKNVNRGIFLCPSFSLSSTPSNNIEISRNSVDAINFGIFCLGIYDKLLIKGNSVKSTSFSNAYIDTDVSKLQISDNSFDGNNTSVTLTNKLTKDCYIYDNVFLAGGRTVSVVNNGSGLVFQPYGINNVRFSSSSLPTGTSRQFVVGDKIDNPNSSLSGWIRITTGVNNVLNADWVLDEQLATESIKGVVNRGVHVPNGSSIDTLLSSLRAAGVISSS